jgi:hypothetical protein
MCRFLARGQHVLSIGAIAQAIPNPVPNPALTPSPSVVDP